MTHVRMSDGISFCVVAVPYRMFTRRWCNAMRGTRWRRFWVRFHSLIGVRLRWKPRFMPVVCRDRDGRLRRRWLNPCQIVYVEEWPP